MVAQEKIAQQIKKEPEDSMVRVLAAQLTDIIAGTQGADELVAQDLENEAMSIKSLQRHFDSYASGHKAGNTAVITPAKAEELIRSFYGLPRRSESPQPPAPATTPAPVSGKVLSLLDFL